MVCVRIQWVNQLIILSLWLICESFVCILYYPLLTSCGRLLKALSSLQKGTCSSRGGTWARSALLPPAAFFLEFTEMETAVPCLHEDLYRDSQLEKDSYFNGKNHWACVCFLFALQRTCHFCPRHCFSSLIEWRKFLKQNNEMAFFWKKKKNIWSSSNYLQIILIAEPRVKQTN